MKVISTGSSFDIYPDDLKSYNRLPADYYIVRFSQRSGFFLEKYSEFQLNEDKIYGVHLEKAQKVLKSFEIFNRNLGVILSGDKGIGKSLFARMLGREAVKLEIPVIIVDCFNDGIGSFIDKIDQEVLVLFDEFDKTFVRHKGDDMDPQASMLSLFDGVAAGKKLFVVTCNEIRSLNGFLVNRPGRFHYHLRFEYPNAEDISDYLKDKLLPEFYGEIKEVISFSKRVTLNYDCLRAIAFELNLGQKFADAVCDLNIVNTEKEAYSITVRFKDGNVLMNKNYNMDSFSGEMQAVYLYNPNGKYGGAIHFPTSAIKYNPIVSELFVDIKDASIDVGNYYDYEYDCDDEEKNLKATLKRMEISSIVIKRAENASIHYAV